MPRKFDAGMSKYAKSHRVSKKQDTRHIIGNKLLGQVRASVKKYGKWAHKGNYRMGSQSMNRSKDTRLDNAIGRVVRSRAPKAKAYNAKALAKPTKAAGGLSIQQQLEGVGMRHVAAKKGLKATDDPAYAKLVAATSNIALHQLGGDGRQFKVPAAAKA